MSHDTVPEPTAINMFGQRLSHVFSGGGFHASSTRLLQRASSKQLLSVAPFPPERPSFSAKSWRNSIGFEPQRRASNNSSTPAIRNGDSIMALRAVAKLNRNLKMSHLTKKTLQKLDIDRHNKVLDQYTLRQHKTTANSVVTQEFPLFVVNPALTWYKIWQLFTLMLIVYQSFQIPYALGFGSNNAGSNPFHDYEGITVNLIFGTDFVLNCITAIPDPTRPNYYITHRFSILWHYLRGWLFLDLAACFPIDIVMYMSVGAGNGINSSLTFLSLLKTVRLPRLLRLARLVRILKILQIPPEYKRWLLYSRYAHLIRLISTIIVFFFTIHLCACVWNGSVASDQWKDMFPSIGDNDANDYVLSYFFCLSTFLGQTMNLHTQDEVVFSIVLIFAGALLMAAVFGDVAVLLANFHEKENEYKKKMESLFACMSTMNLPMDLQNRINEFYQTMWETHATLDGQPATLTSELSRNLALEVELFLRMEMINRVPIFRTCSKRVVQEIVMKLSMEVFLPGDYVVVRGDVAFEMYFVQTGICEVTNGGRDSSSMADVLVHESETVLRLLRQGDFFGEIALLMQCKRTANVRAKIFAELCVLTRDVFESISERYVEDRARMERHITEKYDPAVLHQIAEQKMRQNAPIDPSAPTNGLGTVKPMVDAIIAMGDRMTKLEAKFALMESHQDAFLAEMRHLMRPATMTTSPRLSTICREPGSPHQYDNSSEDDEVGAEVLPE
ncbi:hypothetical protein, variant [Aphanomyces invadans]|uniref:Cyclic nucleotide-binding domain-containing protein n=1 Tax=Aphanomyces invadans TaxID=157072 RepID=A0A024UHF0_9STRA|nr:hypothetical protein, variant [Aphanomyces invadans]ETW05625.1 hypothetical protein, variant [Aphanomyces invadans]|eukprot:XP_008865402.1 hypothetical protein, variant [Aphanomyces invadans]